MSMTTDAARAAATIELPVPEGILHGDLFVPAGAKGLVLFAHGSGSSRLSPRNRKVAEALQRERLATLLFDLLTADEEEEDDLTGALRFDIAMLSGRLVVATEWAQAQPEARSLPIGYFGASTGAAAALAAAAQLPAVRAVVSRGGRPDLAGDALPFVTAPTLLIVGGRDEAVLALNRQALERLGSRERRLAIIPGASHLFEEPGAMGHVTDLARGWFGTHLAPP